MTLLTFRQNIVAASILFTIMFFGFFHITESPAFSFDEGWAIQVATNLSQKGIDGLQFVPGVIEHVSILTSAGYPLMYAEALWFKVFGPGLLQARAMMVVYMLAFAIVSFLLLRRLYGATFALSSLAVLATFPTFYYFGRSVLGEIPLLFFLVCFLLFLHLAGEGSDKKRLWLFLAGTSAGLCVAAKTMGLAFIPVLVVGIFLARRRGLVSWGDIGILAVSVSLPVGVWLVVNFQPGDSLASILHYYSNPSALTDRTATFWLNLQKLFTNIGPLFMWSLMAAWILGLIVRMRAKMQISIEELVALLFAGGLIFSLLFRYYDARYLFPIQTLAILFFSYSLYALWMAFPVDIEATRKTKIFILGICMLSAAGLYQVAFRSHLADSYDNHAVADMTAYFATIPDSTSVFFYNVPQLVPLFRGNEYYQRFAVFESWVLGSAFAPIIAAGDVDLLVLGALSKEDQKVSLREYVQVAQFGEVSVFKKRRDNNSWAGRGNAVRGPF